VKQVTAFDPACDLIIIEALICGPRRAIPARLVVDTGAGATTLVPDMLDQIGYGPRDGQGTTSVSTAVGKEQGYIQRLSNFTALGFSVPDFRVNVFDLAERYGFDGLLGLNFLSQFNYEIRSAEGRILVEAITR
jgi:predicted aspartyl protease